MERILSKEEISELLSAVKQGELDVGSELDSTGDSQSVTRMDLVQTPGPGNWKIPNLDLVFEGFGRNYGISLTNRLQRPVSVKLASLDSVDFETALQRLHQHSAIGILNLEPCNAGGLLAFDEKMAFSFLEFQLGGAADGNVLSLDRPMTPIEINLLKAVMKDSCADLQKAFHPVETLKPSLVKVENSTRMVNIVTPESGVMVAHFDVSVDTLSGAIGLIIPHLSLEPLREKLRDRFLPGSSQRSEYWPQLLRSGVRDVPTVVSAQVGEAVLTVRDILNFQVGDIIDFGCAPNSPVKILVEGKEKFMALAGTLNGNKAVRLTGRSLNEIND